MLVAHETLRWLVGELARLSKKVDGATGFAVNDHNSLAVNEERIDRPRADNRGIQFIIQGRGVIEGYEHARWVYSANLIIPSGEEDFLTTLDGMRVVSGTDFDAYNTMERLTNAGYKHPGVEGVIGVPTGSRLPGWWSLKDGKPIIMFAFQNEPICSGVDYDPAELE